MEDFFSGDFDWSALSDEDWNALFSDPDFLSGADDWASAALPMYDDPMSGISTMDVPVLQEPGFFDGFSSVLSKIGGGLGETFAKNPLGFISAGLGVGLTAYGLFKNSDGSYTNAATGQRIQLSPQEQQLLDTLNQQIANKAAVQNPLLGAYKTALEDPASQANLQSIFKGGLGTLAGQSQAQGYLNNQIYQSALGQLPSTDPLSQSLNASWQNAGNRDALVGDYMTLLRQRYANDPNNPITPGQPIVDRLNQYSEALMQNYAQKFGNMALEGDPYLQQRAKSADQYAQGWANQANTAFDKASQISDYGLPQLRNLFEQQQNDPVQAKLQADFLAGNPQNDEIVRLYGERVLAALRGEGDLDPQLAEEQEEARQAAKEAALRAYGPGYETTSFYQNALSEMLQDQEQARFTNRRQILGEDNSQRLASMKAGQDEMAQIAQLLQQGKITNAQAYNAYANAFSNILGAQTGLGNSLAGAATGAFNAATGGFNADTNYRKAMGDLGLGAGNLALGVYNAGLGTRQVMAGIEDQNFRNVLAGSPSGSQNIAQMYGLSQQGSMSPSQSLALMAGADPTSAALNTFNSYNSAQNSYYNQLLQQQQLANQGQAALLGAGGSLLGGALGSYLMNNRRA